MRRTVAVPCLVLLALAGCGGAAKNSLSASDLRTQATRLCTIARKQTDRIATPTGPATAAAFLNRGLAVLDPELKALRQLHPSGDLGQVYATAIDAFAQKVNALRTAAATLAGNGDPVVTMKSLEQQIAPLEGQENGAWLALEIPACLNR
jgi:hypothetical protein